jgi:hypothetical protein
MIPGEYRSALLAAVVILAALGLVAVMRRTRNQAQQTTLAVLAGFTLARAFTITTLTRRGGGQ